MDCDYLLPQHEFYTLTGEGICLLSKGHKGGHISKLANGEFVEWWPDWLKCEHGPNEDCECFSYKYLSAEETQEKIKK